MSSIMDRLTELKQQYKDMTENKTQTRDITQEFVLRSKLRDLHNTCKVLISYMIVFIVKLYSRFYICI